MPAILVPPETLLTVQEGIAQQHRDKIFCPKVVAVVKNRTGAYLVTKSQNNCWGFVQGRVGDGEDVIAALLRKLESEVGIKSSDIWMVRSHIFTMRRDTLTGREGFSRGQQYDYFSVRCWETPDVVMREGEVVDFHWYPPAYAKKFIDQQLQANDKKLHMHRAFDYIEAQQMKAL